MDRESERIEHLKRRHEGHDLGHNRRHILVFTEKVTEVLAIASVLGGFVVDIMLTYIPSDQQHHHDYCSDAHAEECCCMCRKACMKWFPGSKKVSDTS